MRGIFFCSKIERVFPRFLICSEYRYNANVYQASKESCTVTDRLFRELMDGSFTGGWSITCRCYSCPWQAQTLAGCGTHDREPLQRSRTSGKARRDGRHNLHAGCPESSRTPEHTGARRASDERILAKMPHSSSAL